MCSDRRVGALAPSSSQPSKTEADQKRHAGFGHRNQAPARGYGAKEGAGEVRVDVVESDSGRIHEAYGIGKVRAVQHRVGQVRAGLHIASLIREVAAEDGLDGINHRPIKLLIRSRKSGAGSGLKSRLFAGAGLFTRRFERTPRQIW